MERPRALEKSEKWIVALTLVFVLAMLGIYFRSALLGEGGGYSIRGGAFVSESASEETPASWQVNVNTATEAELMWLPGVGEVLAGRIVDYRENHGPFRTAEDLLNVEGIGESKLSAMREQIIFEEATE